MSTKQPPRWTRIARLLGWTGFGLIVVVTGLVFAMRPRVGPVSDAIGAAVVSPETRSITISALTSFDWDELYVFGPYNDKDEVCRRLALDRAQCIFQVKEDFSNDGVQSLVFRLRGTVVHSELHARWHGDFYPSPPNQPLTPLRAVFDVTVSGVSTVGDPWRVLLLRSAKYEKASSGDDRSTAGTL